jgi:hypothetical protein
MPKVSRRATKKMLAHEARMATEEEEIRLAGLHAQAVKLAYHKAEQKAAKEEPELRALLNEFHRLYRELKELGGDNLPKDPEGGWDEPTFAMWKECMFTMHDWLRGREKMCEKYYEGPFYVFKWEGKEAFYKQALKEAKLRHAMDAMKL